VTFTFDLLTSAVSDELSLIHPTHVPIFSTLRLSVTGFRGVGCSLIEESKKRRKN